MILRLLLLIFVSLNIVSCGPVYTTEYEIIPPQTEIGSICANNCLLLKANCESQCRERADYCHHIKDLEAQNRFLLEKAIANSSTSKSNYGLGSKWESYDSLPSYDRYNSCSESKCSDDCTTHYLICHKNCGGEIITRTKCTAFCN